MLIGLCGSTCAGKSTVAEYLIDKEGFVPIRVNKIKPDGAVKSTVGGLSTQRGETFSSLEDLLVFVTTHWNGRWIITRIDTEYLLDMLQRRPFFLLVYVDAPVSLRWKRFLDV